MAQAPPSVHRPPSLLLLGLERVLPMALSWGKTDKCDKDRRSSWRDGRLTYQVALQEGCGRKRGGETEKERMCERQPDGQHHSWGGAGPGPGASCCLPRSAWAGLGAGWLPLSHPAGWRVSCWGQGSSGQEDALEVPIRLWSGAAGLGLGGRSGLYLCVLSSAASECPMTSS